MVNINKGKTIVNKKVRIREDLDKLREEINNKEEACERIYPIELFFRGYIVTVVREYPDLEGYGVVYENSRKFFVHKSHIEVI